ncbi:MAG TPA: DUF3606 domain-containing protein [Oleiagrimonas sp.]|nr:DUF3606 domain-containing protein [Oleiagrimonas sp.]
MSPDSRESASIDATRIDLVEPWEIDYWTETFGVSEKRLRHAIDEVGHAPAEVRRYLARETSLDPPSSTH